MSAGKNTTPFGAVLNECITEIEALLQEQKEVAERIKEQWKYWKGRGIRVKTAKKVIADRKLTKDQRALENKFHQLYLAGMGMLEGTELGDLARRQADEARKHEVEDDDREHAEGADGVPAAHDGPPLMIDDAALDAAREAGKLAAADGASIFANPYIAGDPRRAKWDEGWCYATGGDGTEIPEAWRPKEKQKKTKAAASEDVLPEDEEANDPDRGYITPPDELNRPRPDPAPPSAPPAPLPKRAPRKRFAKPAKKKAKK